MKRHTLNRVAAVLVRLDRRIEAQCFNPAADVPDAVAIVGAFNREAGQLESYVRRRAGTLDAYVHDDDLQRVALVLRNLRRLVAIHLQLLQQRGRR